jgi:hypothetical protein
MSDSTLHMRCLECAYNLHSLTERRCPECGKEFDPDDPSTYELTSPALRRRARAKLAFILAATANAIVGALSVVLFFVAITSMEGLQPPALERLLSMFVHACAWVYSITWPMALVAAVYYLYRCMSVSRVLLVVLWMAGTGVLLRYELAFL